MRCAMRINDAHHVLRHARGRRLVYQTEPYRNLTEPAKRAVHPLHYPKCLEQQLKSSVERTNQRPRKTRPKHQDQVQIHYSTLQDSVNTSSKILQRLKSQFLTLLQREKMKFRL